METNKDDVINKLLKRIADLEWEVEYLEKQVNEYKDILYKRGKKEEEENKKGE